jgi:hypothetical protein
VDNRTFLTIISITQDLAYAVTFLLAAGAAYLALRQPHVKLRLDDAGPLVTAVVFVTLATLLYQGVSPIVGHLFAFPRGLISTNPDTGFTSSVQCLRGILVLAGFVAGAWFLIKGRAPAPGE